MDIQNYSRQPDELRKQILKKRNKISDKVRKKIFNKILEDFFQLEVYKKSKNILSYFGKTTSGEFNTISMMKHLIKDKKNLYLPKCVENQIALEIYKVRNLDSDIELGMYDIFEPIPTQTTLVTLDQIDMILVPGSVFDRKCNRYGYGAGYYDSLLKNFNGIKIALTFDFCVMNFILKTHSNDVPLDLIITQKSIYES